jgi:hypothetical protein
MKEVKMDGLNRQRSRSVSTFLFSGLLIGGVAACTAVPALAASASFTKAGSMNTARFGHTITLLGNGQVLAVGGKNDTDGYLASAELYDPSKGKWTFTGSMTVPRQRPSAVLLKNGQVLVAGGVNESSGSTPLTSTELYNPATGTWTATGSFSGGALGAAVPLQNGQVLAVGASVAALYYPRHRYLALASRGYTFDKNSGTFVTIVSAELYTP